jgi:hypothetical protein
MRFVVESSARYCVLFYAFELVDLALRRLNRQIAEKGKARWCEPGLCCAPLSGAIFASAIQNRSRQSVLGSSTSGKLPMTDSSRNRNLRSPSLQ